MKKAFRSRSRNSPYIKVKKKIVISATTTADMTILMLSSRYFRSSSCKLSNFFVSRNS